MSSFLHEHFGRWTGKFGMCGSLENPKEGERFASGGCIFPQRG
jgi:hypothetical protein